MGNYSSINISLLGIYCNTANQMLTFTIEGASVVWHLSLPLMNSFNKTEAAVVLCRLCFQGAFLFSLLHLLFILTLTRERQWLHTHPVQILNWWKGKRSGNIACTRKQHICFISITSINKALTKNARTSETLQNCITFTK